MTDTTTPRTFDTVKSDYVKVWRYPWHFIWDNRNKWIVFGYRTKVKKAYRYYYFGPFNLIVSSATGKPDTPYDIWFRIRWGFRPGDGVTGNLWSILMGKGWS